MSVAPGCCPQHPQVIAGFRCEAECQKLICGACTARTVNQHFCCKCGGAASQLTIARSAQPTSHWVTGALAYPVRAGLPLFAGASSTGTPGITGPLLTTTVTGPATALHVDELHALTRYL